VPEFEVQLIEVVVNHRKVHVSARTAKAAIASAKAMAAKQAGDSVFYLESGIEPSLLRSAKEYKQLEKKSDDARNAMDDIVEDAVKAAGMDNVVVCYSAYETDGDGIPINNLAEVPITGFVKIIDEAGYSGQTLKNPTWLDLCVEANRMILSTKDTHHCFLEGIHVNSYRPKSRKKTNLCHFDMGS
jgi:hypothetical protein